MADWQESWEVTTDDRRCRRQCACGFSPRPRKARPRLRHRSARAVDDAAGTAIATSTAATGASGRIRRDGA